MISGFFETQLLLPSWRASGPLLSDTQSCCLLKVFMKSTLRHKSVPWVMAHFELVELDRGRGSGYSGCWMPFAMVSASTEGTSLETMVMPMRPS